ncbi:MAG: D-alanine--D-alanine ligase [Acidimicrobiia bacterium]|nr:D-alanine--D-alanine ligase [Acidimicrobiia bacterium]
MAHVLLVFGGRSAEHEISCVSAVAILEALSGAGHEVLPIGIDRSGGWHLAESGSDPLVAAGPAVAFSIPEGTISGPDGSIPFDVIFPVLHGPYGEDGTIQGMFDMAGVRYVGCGVLGSALAMDKDIAKRLFSQAGLPTATYRAIRSPAAASVTEEIGYPLFVKPASMGSSLGVSRVDEPAQLPAALDAAFALSDKVILEENIPGREIEVAVLDGPRTSLPGEIVLQKEWYDFDAKYTDDTSEFVAPADLTKEQTKEVRELAASAFTVLECVGLARVDFRLHPERGFLINEVNTMPGFTPISGFPKMWIASGMTYAELCDELVQLAL